MLKFVANRSFATDTKSNLSVISLCTCKGIKWFNRDCFIVVRRYVSILLGAEKLLSETVWLLALQVRISDNVDLDLSTLSCNAPTHL